MTDLRANVVKDGHLSPVSRAYKVELDPSNAQSVMSPEVIGRLETPVEFGSLANVSVEPLREAGISFRWLQ